MLETAKSCAFKLSTWCFPSFNRLKPWLRNRFWVWILNVCGYKNHITGPMFGKFEHFWVTPTMSGNKQNKFRFWVVHMNQVNPIGRSFCCSESTSRAGLCSPCAWGISCAWRQMEPWGRRCPTIVGSFLRESHGFSTSLCYLCASLPEGWSYFIICINCTDLTGMMAW